MHILKQWKIKCFKLSDKQEMMKTHFIQEHQLVSKYGTVQLV